MKTVYAVIALCAVGCVNQIDPPRERDYCDLPNFSAPECFVHTDDMGQRMICPTDDGTEWTLWGSAISQRRTRYETLEGTHISVRVLCDVMADGTVFFRAAKSDGGMNGDGE